MEAYSKEMRRDVLRACETSGTRAVALRFKVSESWVRRVKQDYRESGKTAPCTTRKRIPRWEPYRARIQELYASTPDLTLTELQTALGTTLAISTLCNALQRMKLTLKKKSSSPTSRIARTSRNVAPIGI